MPAERSLPLPAPQRAHVRDLFLRLLGIVFLIAFLSLLPQVTLLVGSRGLLPVRELLTPALVTRARRSAAQPRVAL